MMGKAFIEQFPNVVPHIVVAGIVLEAGVISRKTERQGKHFPNLG
jgi:hypothetical protein